MKKYHVALSFAGEEREYVEKVARCLQEQGIRVFYDKFEETTLWGKDLYTYLSEIYQDRAYFTIMFISNAYKEKLWTNHERANAQARAFSENREYILPAFFDRNVEVPGVLKTTGYIDLSNRSPEEFSQLIVSKLKESNVIIENTTMYEYSVYARKDWNFPIKSDNKVSEILTALRSHDWPTQRPAIEEIFRLDWKKVTPDEAFVLGRNIYQCADGDENRAKAVMNDLQRSLALIPDDRALHILNGMFYEVYFNHEGEFRGSKLKGRFLSSLFSVETVLRFKESILFIRSALEPYRSSLGILPSTTPEELDVLVTVKEVDPPEISSVVARGKEQLLSITDDRFNLGWRFSYRGFTAKDFTDELMKFWNIPEDHLRIEFDQEFSSSAKLHLSEGMTLGTLMV